ncbi:MAG: Methyltransferase type 11 [Candidatus Peribacteria bacterium]|nr:Methyltransferase type 11 [Candidatus Peribacteria bacterium]
MVSRAMIRAMDLAKMIAPVYGTRETMMLLADSIHGDVLDFGAGKGKQKQFILKQTKAKSYTALDITPHENIDIVGDVLDPPLDDESFDTIISNQVIEHVRKPWMMVHHIARILRPKGTVIITAPFFVPYHAHPHDYFRFTEEGLKSLCEDHGLTVSLCTKYGGFWSSVGELVKQRCFSPYRNRSRFTRLLSSKTERIFRFLNYFCPPGITYSSVVCVAHKL